MYDILRALSGEQHIPTARGRMVKGRAMSGSKDEVAIAQKRPPTGDEKVDDRREMKRLSEMRARLRNRGIPDSVLRKCTEEEMREMTAGFVKQDNERKSEIAARVREGVQRAMVIRSAKKLMEKK